MKSCIRKCLALEDRPPPPWPGRWTSALIVLGVDPTNVGGPQSLSTNRTEISRYDL
jgi:hypothetical protein